MNKIAQFVKKLSKETIVGLIYFALGVVLLVQVLKIKNIESAILAYAVMALYFAMCVWIILSGIVGKERQPMSGFFYKLREVILLAVLLLLQILTKYVSFYILVIPFVFGVNLIITKDVSKRNILVSLIYAISVGLVVFVLCRYGLKISI